MDMRIFLRTGLEPAGGSGRLGSERETDDEARAGAGRALDVQNPVVGSAQLAALDFATAPVFAVNGLKREELIATNSMILHELYFDGLGADGEPDRALRDALVRDFGSVDRWRTEFVAMGKAMGEIGRAHV